MSSSAKNRGLPLIEVLAREDMAELRQMAADLKLKMASLEMEPETTSADRYPRTIDAAWDHLWTMLRNEGLTDETIRAEPHGVDYREAIANAVNTLAASGRLTRDQILAVGRLCHLVARAARITS